MNRGLRKIEGAKWELSVIPYPYTDDEGAWRYLVKVKFREGNIVMRLWGIHYCTAVSREKAIQRALDYAAKRWGVTFDPPTAEQMEKW